MTDAGIEHEVIKLAHEWTFSISLTFDPETDTLERFKAWAQKYGRREGWTLLTGAPDEVAKVVGHLPGSELGKV